MMDRRAVAIAAMSDASFGDEVDAEVAGDALEEIGLDRSLAEACRLSGCVPEFDLSVLARMRAQ